MRAAVLFALAACNLDAKLADPDAPDPPDAPDATSPRCDPTKPFGEFTQLGFNTTFDDTDVKLTSTETIFYFSSTRTGGRGLADLYQVTRNADGSFASPVSLGGGVNTADSEEASFVTADNKTIYFERKASDGTSQIMVATRASIDGEFLQAAPVAGVNTGSEGTPWLSDDLQTLYFSSARAGGAGLADLWQARRRTDGTFDTPVLILGVNTDRAENHPIVTSDEKTLIFASQRTDFGLPGPQHIFIASRTDRDSAFGPPSPIPEVFEGIQAVGVLDWISPDLCALYVDDNKDVYVATRPR